MEPEAYSLPARIFLLACDPDRERLRGGGELGYAVRAAALADLVERGCLADDGGRAKPRDRRTGDPVLDGVLRTLAQQRPRRWKALVARDRRQTCLALEEQLAAAGEIKVRSRPLRRKRIQVRERELTERLRVRAADVLLGDVPVREVPPADAALASMAAHAGLSPLVSRRDRFRNRSRLKELTERAGVAGPALKRALDARRAAAANNGGGGG